MLARMMASSMRPASFMPLKKRQELKVGCPEEIDKHQGWISDAELASLADLLRKSGMANI
jgi:hypothetical protein